MALFDVFGSLARRGVRALVRFYYPRIEVAGAGKIPATGPVILAANHPNSLVDPVLLGIAARRPVLLMAKAPLFAIPVFGPLLRALGMVPVYRGSDDARLVTKNLESLQAAAVRVAAGQVMGIFPEGKSHDAVQLAKVRSGAARLALEAWEAGATDVQLVPVGLNYEAKDRFRTAVWIQVGEPINVGAWRSAHGDDKQLAKRTLTTELQARLTDCVVHLDDPAWEDLLEDVAIVLPAAGFQRSDPLAVLRQRKAVADAINHFQRADPPMAERAAALVRAHAAELRKAGLASAAHLLLAGKWRLAARLAGDGLALAVGFLGGFLGALHHALPYGVVRLLAGFATTPGRMTIALYRMLFSVPVYLAWYACVWVWQSRIFMPWVAWTWVALMPLAGLAALRTARRLRVAFPLWRGHLRLFLRAGEARRLREEHRELAAELAKLAAAVPAAMVHTDVAPGVVVLHRPPVWTTMAVGVLAGGMLLTGGLWLLRDRPLEVLRNEGPALHQLTDVQLDARMHSDERALKAHLAGLLELAARSKAFDEEMSAGTRSFYRQEDDDEIRRMLVSFLSHRAALLRIVWTYQRHHQIEDESSRLRALLLHYTAAAAAYDYAARFVVGFEGRAEAIRKLNEPEPRWGLEPGIYDRIRGNLGNLSHRRWLEAGWRQYHETLPRWVELGLAEGEPYAMFHATIAAAGESTAGLSEQLLRYKLATAATDVGTFTRSGFYRASSAISTLVGQTKIREPRNGASLISAELLNDLKTRLQPGDILIERRNWYLSNAFLPGYWPHAALYVGTMDELRELGLDADPRVAPHLDAFARTDANGHAHAVIEAIGAGVVFTSVEHSAGEADSVAVLRPRLPLDQRREIIARAFDHAGKPYDFDFDFFSSDRLVCTELVYRATSGYLDFPLVDILGRKTLPALEIVRYWTSPAGAAQLEFVAFLDGDEDTGRAREADDAALAQSVTRPALTWLN